MSGNRLSTRAAPAVLAVAAIAFIGIRMPFASGTSHRATATSAATVTVQSGTISQPIPQGFVGLSMEYRGLAAYAGSNPNAVDPAFVQLLRDIAPNQRTVLRVGGDSTDWTWWPVPNMAQPGGVRYALTPSYMQVTHNLVKALNAKLILGVNLEADSRRVAAVEAQAMIDHLGRGAIAALEVGNEPELYDSFGWYKSATGQQVKGRSPGYGLPQFTSDFSSIGGAVPGGVPLAGPSSGSLNWLAQLGQFLGHEPRVRLATVHAYPLRHCNSSEVVTIPELLSNQASRGLAQRVAPWVAAGRAHGVSVRLDEMNAVSCGGYRGVSNSFASALWALDTMFEMAKVGVGGVNVHTVPNTINEILGPNFDGKTWQMRVHPEYYGLIMFAQAAPPGSRLLRITGSQSSSVKEWATRGPDGLIRVVLINKQLSQAAVARVRIPATGGPASLEQLRAPKAGATSGVTLGGQSFGSQTSTGVLSGPSDQTTVTPSGGVYVVRVPPATASLLTILKPAGG